MSDLRQFLVVLPLLLALMALMWVVFTVQWHLCVCLSVCLFFHTLS